MKRKLDLDQTFRTFEGKTFTDNGQPDGKSMNLRDLIFGYLRHSGSMGLDDREQRLAYETGLVLTTVGQDMQSKHFVELTTGQYNLIKQLADNGKVKDAAGVETPVYAMELRFGIAEAIDRATIIEPNAPETPPEAPAADPAAGVGSSTDL